MISSAHSKRSGAIPSLPPSSLGRGELSIDTGSKDENGTPALISHSYVSATEDSGGSSLAFAAEPAFEVVMAVALGVALPHTYVSLSSDDVVVALSTRSHGWDSWGRILTDVKVRSSFEELPCPTVTSVSWTSSTNGAVGVNRASGPKVGGPCCCCCCCCASTFCCVLVILLLLGALTLVISRDSFLFSCTKFS